MLDSQLNRPVSPRSLPDCLTLFSRDDALEKARSLSRFLQDAVESMASGGSLSEQNSYGAYQCFDLLNDLLAIASGAYLFPLSGKESDPELCHREEVARHA